MKLIERKEYLDKLIECKGSSDIKVITGIRRCGKSISVSQYMDYLKNNVKNLNSTFGGQMEGRINAIFAKLFYFEFVVFLHFQFSVYK